MQKPSHNAPSSKFLKSIMSSLPKKFYAIVFIILVFIYCKLTNLSRWSSLANATSQSILT